LSRTVLVRLEVTLGCCRFGFLGTGIGLGVRVGVGVGTGVGVAFDLRVRVRAVRHWSQASRLAIVDHGH
jgi:hypothetical protein